MSETNALQTVGKNTGADPFGTNAAASFAYAKAERLVTATFLVTNHIPKGESLRARVRDIVSELLTDTIALREGFASSGTDALSSIIARVRLVLSLLDTLFATSLISEMNLRVLKEAYIDFVRSLEEMKGAGVAEGVELSPEYFGTMTTRKNDVRVAAPAPHAQISPKSTLGGVEVMPVATERAENKMLKIQTKTTKPQDKQSVNTAQNNARITTIIDFIHKRKEATVPDIAQVIRNCSNKTLQRDLAGLVGRGVLSKTGEKRWTKYRLT